MMYVHTYTFTCMYHVYVMCTYIVHVPGTVEHSPISMAIMPPKLELRTPRGHRVGERLPEIQLP